jgi:hypothetical protein
MRGWVRDRPSVPTIWKAHYSFFRVVIFIAYNRPRACRPIELQSSSDVPLFHDYGYNPCTVAIWAGSVRITTVENPAMSAVETGLGQDGSRKGWNPDQL